MEGIDPPTIVFDETLPYSDRMPAINRGCPEGYFAMLVDPHYGGDSKLVAPIPGVTSQPNYIVCRIIPDAMLDGRPPDTVVFSDPMSGMTVTVGDEVSAAIQQVKSESGNSWQTSVDNLEQAAKQTIPQAGLNITKVLLVIGAILVLPRIVGDLVRRR